MSILNTLLQPKRYFDVTNKKDVAVFRDFLKSNSWGAKCCPFEIEEPFLTVPDMIKDKLVRKNLKV